MSCPIQIHPLSLHLHRSCRAPPQGKALIYLKDEAVARRDGLPGKSRSDALRFPFYFMRCRFIFIFFFLCSNQLGAVSHTCVISASRFGSALTEFLETTPNMVIWIMEGPRALCIPVRGGDHESFVPANISKYI